MNEVLTSPQEYAQECHGVYSVALYTADECAAVVAEARAADAWETAQITVENADGKAESIEDASTRSARILDGNKGAAVLNDFEARVCQRVIPAVRLIWDVDLRELLGTQLVHYRPGGHYAAHQDGGGSFDNRYFTILCYLNADFEGGQTRFPSVPYLATPETGKAIIFPSNFFHCAEPVTRGEKYIFVTWLCAPPPIRWI